MRTPFSLIYSTYTGDDAPQNCFFFSIPLCTSAVPLPHLRHKT